MSTDPTQQDITDLICALNGTIKRISEALYTVPDNERVVLATRISEISQEIQRLSTASRNDAKASDTIGAESMEELRRKFDKMFPNGTPTDDTVDVWESRDNVQSTETPPESSDAPDRHLPTPPPSDAS